MATPYKKNTGYRGAVVEPKGNPYTLTPEKEENKALLGNNFLLVGIAGFMIILGFILISGSPSGLDEYNPDIYSTRRIVVGPTICFLGFVLMAIAILVKPKRLSGLFGKGKKEMAGETKAKA